ncbi:MAG: sulfite exporter TauE/SafE family protein, partial [Candidatus Omnitrophica bacterium]|nr:sulfite exporter TauE/SafE family protein [Candidatus Omnitrophota bacterium]
MLIKNNNLKTINLKSLLFCAFLFLPASRGFAHEPDKVFHQTKIIVANQVVIIKYDSIFGSILAKVNSIKADEDKNGSIGSAEKDVFLRSFAKDVLSKLDLKIDNEKREIVFQVGELRDLPGEHMQIVLNFVILISDISKGKHSIVLNDNNFPDVALGEMNFLVHDSGASKILSFEQDNRMLKCEFSYQNIVPIEAVVKQETKIEHIAEQKQSAAKESGLSRILKKEKLSPWFMIISLFIAVGIGALHALSPGHGKTIAAAYLVGERGTVRDAILLGCVVTFAHVGSIVLMGILVLYLSEFILPQQMYPWFSFISGVIIFIVGICMLKRWIYGRTNILTGHHHHDHKHESGKEHESHEHSHISEGKISLMSLFMLGISGGMVPCPAALVVLLAAISMNRIVFGLSLILAFSIGLAIVLILIGILVIKSQKFLLGSKTQNK